MSDDVVTDDVQGNAISIQQEWYEAVNDLLESAWGIIANAYGGNWDLAQNPDWKPAAERWRDRYHAALGEQP